MEEVKSNLEKRGLSKSSIDLYLKNLLKLNDGKPFTNLNFLKSISNIEDKIKKFKPNTQRTIYISIVSSLKGLNEKLYKKYYDMMININNSIKDNPINEKSEIQTKNWIEKEEIENKLKELKDNVLTLKKPLSKEEYKTVLKFIILSLYTLIPPRRNKDYYNMEIWNNKDNMEQSKNYLDLKNNKFIFNDYKTFKKYGKQEVEINDELMNNINIYFKLRPDYKTSIKSILGKPFLILDVGDFQPNTITRILNKVFNKNIGSSMIRHIYLSDKYKDTLKEQEEDANKMGHSLSTQKEYIKK
jgi:preprotein translocase subunit Sss1